MRRRPLVSVCVPAFDGARTLRRCLESARRQTFRDLELVVVDDASADATPDVIADAARRETRLRAFRNAGRLGMAANWNRCAALARGTWLKFVFQDDLLDPDCLERMLAAAGPRDALVVARRRLRFESGVGAAVKAEYRADAREHDLRRRFPGPSRVSAARVARLMVHRPTDNCVGEPSAVLIRRDALRRFGGFDPALAMLCDWELCARVAVNAGLRRVDAPLATFRVHGGSVSAAHRRRDRYRAEVLDGLLIREALACSPAYAPVRRAARRWRPPVDLRAALATAVSEARRLARRYPGGRAAWAELLARRPRLAAAARRPAPSLPLSAGLRRAALDLLAAANH
ncbi:MAG: glycosyltransferase [Elusimicrobia bacterium]|nr:glycosyltransferase [Elusimicrobiota bacterium]